MVVVLIFFRWSALPLDSGGSQSPQDNVEEFVHSLKRTLPQPILASPPCLRVIRALSRDDEDDDDDLVPVLRQRAGFREQKPEAQASKVMMKKLGFSH